MPVAQVQNAHVQSYIVLQLSVENPKNPEI